MEGDIGKELIPQQYKRKYAEKYGIYELMNNFECPSLWKGEVSEKIYKECLDKGVTWRQFLNIPKPQKGILL